MAKGLVDSSMSDTSLEKAGQCFSRERICPVTALVHSIPVPASMASKDSPWTHGGKQRTFQFPSR